MAVFHDSSENHSQEKGVLNLSQLVLSTDVGIPKVKTSPNLTSEVSTYLLAC